MSRERVYDIFVKESRRYVINAAIGLARNFAPVIHARVMRIRTAVRRDYPPNFQTRGLIIHIVAACALFHTARHDPRSHPILTRDVQIHLRRIHLCSH